MEGARPRPRAAAPPGSRTTRATRRLGRADEARKELVEASRLASTVPWDGMILAGREVPPRSHWHDWLGHNVLRHEAEALILDPAFPADPFER